MNDSFKFWLDADVVKSEDGVEERRLIRGYASTEDEDRQGESLVQKGLDISDFVNHGYFNYDHDNSIIMGYPLPTCRVDNHGFWVEGELLKGIPHADRIWELAKALKKSRAPRRVGFSIEGKVMERDGNRITKARIYNVAITTNPVNTNCSWEAVAKSFAAPVEPENGYLGVNNDKAKLDGIPITEVHKALEAGYETNPSDMEGGEVFRKESLEGSLKNLSYVIGDEDKKKILKQKLSTKKSLTSNELTLYLQIVHGWSQGQANDFIANLK